ncbi:LOW QUALITY PROTEIN: Transposase [Phytophthora palmivora]|uniref:Transposase n=1 Tax=Phytophthora palmivora TaxID=4796 RepID=A0A2P4YUG2_9STRA|nr:LOW QUALITY PROTEIN: Transposase [Phytophthora palmivora]
MMRQGNLNLQASAMMESCFFSVIFCVPLPDKGQYLNYWGIEIEDAIFSGASTRLDSVMSLRRFELIYRYLIFALTLGRRLYIEVGRDHALDEDSIACRSRHDRRLIVSNPQKPGGKYHFRIVLVGHMDELL